MITLKDLNIPAKCWNWICELTEDYKLTNNHITCKNNARCTWIGNAYQGIHGKNDMESIIYQAIDGLMDQDKYVIATNPYKQYKSVEVYTENDLCESFSFHNYQNKTIARLDALRWVWERETVK